MAIFVNGMSCALCGMVISSSRDCVFFPPLIKMQSDPLWIFSDAVVHKGCLDMHEMAGCACECCEEVLRMGAPDRRVCAVCGMRILDVGDYFGTSLLTRNQTDTLYRFNYVHLHVSHASAWEDLAEFKEAIIRSQSCQDWRGAVVVFGEKGDKAIAWSRSKPQGCDP